MSVDILRRSGLEGFQVLINSVGCPDCRPAFVELLRDNWPRCAPAMCGDCQRRAVTNPLRVLDCKVPEDQPIIETLPSILDHLGCEVRGAFCGGAERSGSSRNRVRSPAEAGARAGLLHAHHLRDDAFAAWVRRIPCWPAGGMTGWRKASARRFPRRAWDSRWAKTGW